MASKLIILLVTLNIINVLGGSLRSSYDSGSVQCPSGRGLSLIPHPTDCQKFYICYTKEPLEVQCPDGKYFDKTILGTLNKCVPPHKSKCSGSNSINTEPEILEDDYEDFGEPDFVIIGGRL